MATIERADETMAMIALSLVDLRAQYQAALRKLDHAEQCLLKCRGRQQDGSLSGYLSSLREEIVVLTHTNRSVRDVLEQIGRDLNRLKPDRLKPLGTGAESPRLRSRGEPER
jgi:hypothetical protein